MAPRESKVHYASGDHRELCGTYGLRTVNPQDITCRRCMFSYLSDAAPWARAFLDDLRRPPAPSPAPNPSPRLETGLGRIDGVDSATADTFREITEP